MNKTILDLTDTLKEQAKKNHFNCNKISRAIAEELIKNYEDQNLVFVYKEVHNKDKTEYFLISEKIDIELITESDGLFAQHLTNDISSHIISLREVYSKQEIQDMEQRNTKLWLFKFSGGITYQHKNYFDGENKFLTATSCESVDHIIENNKVSAYLQTIRPLSSGMRALIKTLPIEKGAKSGVAFNEFFKYENNDEFLKRPL
jgi:hypothetical protein